MKKIILFLSAVFLLVVSVQAQVAINNDHSQADASAVLDVKSAIRGVLFPRMTRAQMSDMANNSLPDGLMVFNTDDGKLYIYVASVSAWKEVKYETGGISGQAVYSIGGSSCSQTIVNGVYESGTALDGTNTVSLYADVTTVGTWSITTATVDGFSFSGSGTFSATGLQRVTLNGTGTPTNIGEQSFTATADNGGGSCTFCVYVGTVLAEDGNIWLDRNLGASEIATGNDGTDYNAYGSLYQWGRLKDGHQLITWTGSSSTDGTPVNGSTTTQSPGDVPGNSDFIYSHYDWRSSSNNSLWQGVDGTNNPCPCGFRIPTIDEWSTEADAWDNVGEDAFTSVLHLTLAGYRDYDDASLNSAGNNGYYWCSTTYSTYSYYLYFGSSGSGNTGYTYRAYGISVRCIKDQ